MSLNVPQLKPDVFIPLIVLLSYPPAAAPASAAADNEVTEKDKCKDIDKYKYNDNDKDMMSSYH